MKQRKHQLETQSPSTNYFEEQPASTNKAANWGSAARLWVPTWDNLLDQLSRLGQVLKPLLGPALSWIQPVEPGIEPVEGLLGAGGA